jgi:hypothetical protein
MSKSPVRFFETGETYSQRKKAKTVQLPNHVVSLRIQNNGNSQHPQ